MSKLISKDEALRGQVYSRDLREYVVPVRLLNMLGTIEEPEEQPADYEDVLRVLFNRCYVAMGRMTCVWCGLRNLCDEKRSVGRVENEKTFQNAPTLGDLLTERRMK